MMLSLPRPPRSAGLWLAALVFASLPAVRPTPSRADNEGFCGDQFCDAEAREDCESCPFDCGGCDLPDAFLCYGGQAAKGAPKFTPMPGVEVKDPYEDLLFTVTEPREVCNPAVRGEGFLTATHLLRYQLAAPERTPRTLPKHVVAVTEFGTVALDAIAGDELLVPAAKSLNGVPQSLQRPAVDHFKCYDVKPSTGSAKFPKGLQVTLTDEFNRVPVAWSIVGPAHLCPVAQKNGEPVLDPCAALVCYGVKRAKGSPKSTPMKHVYTNDQFGALTLAAVDKNEVCVPATIVDGETPICLPGDVTTSTSTSSTTTSSIPWRP